MLPRFAPRTDYSSAERTSDGVVHMLGLGMMLVGVPALIAIAVVMRGDWATVSATSVYGISAIAMLGCSALCNMSNSARWQPLFRRLDHSAIYIKIAGTYTPLVALSGGAGLTLLAGIWTAALGGVGLKVASPDRLRWLGLALYLGIGWIGVLAGSDVIGALSGPALGLVIAGGVLYTLGVGFFLWDRLPFHNTIWHSFVLVASVAFYLAIAVELLSTA